jgi:Matrixin
VRRRELIVSLAGAALLTHGIMPKRSAMAAWLGFTWTKVPAIIVVGAAEDRRLPLTRDAVAFWNETLARLGSGFRLGAITQGPERVPDAVIAGMSRSVLSGRKVEFPPELASIPGDIIVALSNVDFMSFSPHWANGKGLVAIKSGSAYPLTLPNVARNVIAHEFGHAIGLAHNADPTKLMCGRPAPCRPRLFQSTTEHYFPLTEDEGALLLQLYPPDWRAR